MTSEITPKTKQEWEECRGRIKAKLGVFAEFHHKTIREMLPDIKAVKERELWRCGGYDSFADFIRRCVGVTKQHIYKLLSEDKLVSNLLEINTGESSLLTPSAAALPPEPAPQTTIEPPPKKPSKSTTKQAKARVIDPQPPVPDIELEPETPAPTSAKCCPTCGKEL